MHHSANPSKNNNEECAIMIIYLFQSLRYTSSILVLCSLILIFKSQQEHLLVCQGIFICYVFHSFLLIKIKLLMSYRVERN